MWKYPEARTELWGMANPWVSWVEQSRATGKGKKTGSHPVIHCHSIFSHIFFSNVGATFSTCRFLSSLSSQPTHSRPTEPAPVDTGLASIRHNFTQFWIESAEFEKFGGYREKSRLPPEWPCFERKQFRQAFWAALLEITGSSTHQWDSFGNTVPMRSFANFRSQDRLHLLL